MLIGAVECTYISKLMLTLLSFIQQLVDPPSRRTSPPSRRMSPYPSRSPAARIIDYDKSFHKSESRLFSPTSPTRAAGTIAGTTYHHHHRGSRGNGGGGGGGAVGGLRSHSPSPPSRYEAVTLNPGRAHSQFATVLIALCETYKVVCFPQKYGLTDLF